MKDEERALAYWEQRAEEAASEALSHTDDCSGEHDAVSGACIAEVREP